MDNPDYFEDSRKPRYVGFIPDLLKEIAELTGMKYVIKTSAENSFGYKQGDGTWDGMIGELIRQVNTANNPGWYLLFMFLLLDYRSYLIVPFRLFKGCIASVCE